MPSKPDSPQYSILVACYDPDNRLTKMTEECIACIKQHSQGKDYELLLDPDPEKTGWSGVFNRLMAKAKGQYLVICANDVLIDDPEWLDKLTVPGTIVSPHLNPFLLTGEIQSYASIFCIPKEVQEQIGFIDEQFRYGYGFDDNDFFHRAFLLGIPQKEVSLIYRHDGSRTYNTYWTSAEHEHGFKMNRDLYMKKWGLA